MNAADSTIRSPADLIWQHRQLILIYIAALLFDTLTTIHFMVRGGIDLEIHPLVRYSAYCYGPVIGPFLSAFLFKFFAGLFLIFYLKHYAHYVLKAAVISSCLAGMFNLWGDLLIFS
jgi:hypothetical protein